MSKFPATPDEFAALEAEGKTVITTETGSENESPGSGWVYWSKRQTPEETRAVWRKIVTLEEAEAWHLEHAE